MAERNEHATLTLLINQQNLLARQPLYYLGKILFTFSLLVASMLFLFLVGNSWFQLLNAVFLAFVFGQMGFLGHDASHHQIFDTPAKNARFGRIIWTLFLGINPNWWTQKHNKHHSHPNQLDEDPDIEFPIVAFSVEQARRKRGVLRLLVKPQAYLFPFFWTLLMPSMRFDSIRTFLHGNRYRSITAALFTLHFLVYFGVLFSVLTPLVAILFIGIHQGLLGLYISSVFAPNHKGMPILARNTSMSYLQKQVHTARNVHGHPLTDFWYGGLNYQIEHHLYPNMPRNNLPKAQRIVKAFCRRHGILYHETGVVQSYREIFAELHRVSATLRTA